MAKGMATHTSIFLALLLGSGLVLAVDSDGDGVDDNVDIWPLNPAYTTDTDYDTLPDNWEVAHGRDPAVADYILGNSCAIDDEGTKYWNGASGICTPPSSRLVPTSVTSTYINVGTTTCGTYLWATNWKHVTCSVSSGSASCTVRYEYTPSPVQWGVCPSATNSYSYYTKPVVRFRQVVVTSSTTFCGLGSLGLDCFTAVNGTDTSDPVTLVIDSDGDGVPRPTDQDDLDPTEQIDTDNDSIGNNSDTDDDNDSVQDSNDNCPQHVNVDQADTDADVEGDACDTDDDNDGIADTADRFPLNAAASSDADNDGYPDSWNAGCDAACQSSSGMMLDNCPASINANQLDSDSDGQGDACDSDDDNDGVADINDECPLDRLASAGNVDLDNLCDINDPDDDNDSISDIVDNCLYAPNPLQLDANSNGIGDLCDTSLGRSMLAAGRNHTCFISKEGSVLCWGSNSDGQLGDGTTINRSMPVPVHELGNNVVSVSAGYAHTCAMTSAGAVKCWGSNVWGQLGDGTTTSSPTPVIVSGLASDVVAMAAGGDHNCAAMATGILKCWGINVYGQLGDGTTTTRKTPVEVSNLGVAAVHIIAGFDHTCATLATSKVKCWGVNASGQLGNGTTTSRYTPAFASVQSAGNLAKGSSSFHSCAITDTGAAKCWGGNDYGQIGDSTTTKRLSPVSVTGMGSDVSVMATGGYHTCMVTIDGTAMCWGNNSYGQLGDGTLIHRNSPVHVSLPSGSTMAIAAGEYHTCALTSAGAVACWGYNNAGQLGDTTITNSRSPVWVTGFADTDYDGITDGADLDDDNDGVPDYIDTAPLNAGNSNEITLPLDSGYKGSTVRDATAVE